TGKGRTVIRGGWGLFYDAFAQDIFIGHAPYNCAFCPGAAFTGLDPAPITTGKVTGDPFDPESFAFTKFSGLGDFFGASKGLRTPYTQNFNLNIQQQLGKAVVQVGYVGARGTKLFRFRDINQPDQDAITAGDTAQCTDVSGLGGVGFIFPNCPILGF